MKRAAVIAALALAATGLVACGGGDSGDGGADAPEKSAWQKVLDGIRDDGTVPKQTALQAFSLAIGPLPGVEVPEGEVGPIRSATGAVRWVSAYYDELPAEQQEAAARLAPELVELPGPGGPGAHLAGPPPGTDSPGAEEYRAEVDALVAEIGPQIGTGPLPYKVQIVLEPKSDGAALMRTWGRDPCTVYIYPEGAALTGADRRNLLAHEIFHCYENLVLNTELYEGQAPWLVEGMAAWVGASLAPTSKVASDFWPDYLTTPAKVLYSRAYDAIGFYAHLEYAGADVWGLLVPMLLAGDSGGNAGALDVAVDPGPLLDDWPSGYARDGGIGKHWDTDGPGITGDVFGLITDTLGNGQVKGKENYQAAAVDILRLDIQADVVTLLDISGSGHIRLPDGKEPPLPELVQAPLCTLPGGCECPEGSTLAGTAFTPTTKGVANVALTGGLNPLTWKLFGESVEDYCKDDDTEEPAASTATGLDPCLVGTWVSTSFNPAVAGQGAVTYEGGAGAVFTIAKDGAATIDFDPMAPLTGALSTGGTSEFGFKGQVSGRISTSGNELFTIEATNNTWQYFGIAQVPGVGAFPFEGAVQSDPAVGNFQATYTCSRSTLEYAVTGQGGFSTGSTWARA